VTPSSQIVGTQAVFNVMMGRYKVLTGEFADLMLGYYGETIGPARPPRGGTGRQTDQQAAHQTPPGGSAEAGMAGTAVGGAGAEGCNGSDEDVLTYAMFPQGGAEVLPRARQGPKNLGKDPAAAPAPAPPPAPAAENGKGRSPPPSPTT
jgi:methylmalonyl-CoA carboxyltransferase 5S subunit